MKKQRTKTLLFGVFLGFLVFFGFLGTKTAQAGAEHNVWGWAWSENIGWISFNNTSGGGAVNYGVNIDSSGVFSGYAWSENIGWISFERADTGDPPGPPYNGAETYIAKVDLVTKEISGWTRALSYGGGWDGWIKIRKDPADVGPSYGAWIDDTANPAEFHEWVWGYEVVGWVSFNCQEQGICLSSDYKVLTSFFDDPPTAVLVPIPSEVNVVGQSNDTVSLDVSGSSDDYGIIEVRFSSDDDLSCIPECTPDGTWTSWFDWDTPSGSWDAAAKVMPWTFATCGDKEVWVEVKDASFQTDQAYDDVYVNCSPTANAGPDKNILESENALLEGSGTDSDGIISTYSWSCTGGSLDDSTLDQPTFTPPSITTDATYTCDLTVADDDGAVSPADSVDINVAALDDFDISTDISSVNAPQTGSSEPVINITVDSLFSFSAQVDLSVVHCLNPSDIVCTEAAIPEISPSLTDSFLTPPAGGSAGTTLSFDTTGALLGLYYYRVRGTSVSPARTHDTDPVITLEVIDLGVTLTANPDYGVGSLSNVDLTAQVSGSATGFAGFKFDCTDDGIYEANYTGGSSIDLSVSDIGWVSRVDDDGIPYDTWITAPDTFAIKDLCDYLAPATYTAKVLAKRDIANDAEGFATIIVSDFTISAVPPTIRAPETGTSQISTITVIPDSGFSSDVALSVSSGLPPGASGSFNPVVVVGGSGNSDFTVTTSGVSQGSYPLTIDGTGGGVSRTTIVNLEVVDLAVTLQAATDSLNWQDPLTGTPPLIGVDLRATVSGTAPGTINYKLWCDCSYGGTDLAEAISQCGPPSWPENGSSENPFVKDNLCDYLVTGSYTTKVLVQRDVANNAEDRASIGVSNPPVADTLAIDYESYCGQGSGEGLIGFSWRYTDLDSDPEARFDIKINDINWIDDPNSEVDRRVCGLSFPPPAVNTQSVSIETSLAPFSQTYCAGTPDEYIVTTPDALTYNTTYYWWVRVWDDNGVSSGWVAGPSFTTDFHAWPWPEFTPVPQKPDVDELVNFTDESICYDTFNSPYSCQTGPLNTYLWDFGDGDTSSDKGDTTHIYLSPSSIGYDVTLSVTNDVGTCSKSETVGVSYPSPLWKEIAPF